MSKTPKTDDAGSDTLISEAGDDTITKADSAHGDEVSRDERHDSIDRETGTLTAEAAELRAEHGITQSGEQLPEGDAAAD